MGFLSDELLFGIPSEAVGEKYYLSYPFGGRFENVLSIETISAQKIVLVLKKTKLILTGENMRVRSYCDRDVTVEGRINCVGRC